MKLSRRQSEALEFIRRHIIDTDRAPSRAELADHLAVWPNQAQELVLALQRRGFIRVEPGKRHGIELAAP